MADLKSNEEWRWWGRHDPLWGVAAWANKQKDGAAPWTEEGFYALGESDWKDFSDRWREYGINQSCLEIGCGAGRITKQLAKSFDRVYAVDVSEDMIARAREAVGSVGRVEFAITNGMRLPQGDRAVKAIFSTHVLQHLDSVDLGFSYFREFFRVLDVGGTMMIHLPLYQIPQESGRAGVIMRSIYAAFRKVDNVQSDRKRRSGVKFMRWTPYPIDALTELLSDLGFKDIEFRIFPLTSNGDPHPFVLAAK